MRRTVLLAAEQGRQPADVDLAAALDALLKTRDKLTRRLLGVDHTRLTFTNNGRDDRLTDTAGQVVRAILA